ncbi:hypothetical protein LJC31_04290 [Synergistaceae bacterium OttesenSCG-928-I11]|nr:hypothetical protein [Synergistaceae bacterium OttesenSCG-928-I11]
MEHKYGITLSMCDPVVVEMAARAGFGFVRIDWEHMIFDSCTVIGMVRLARLVGIPVHVRVPNLANVSALLDLGIMGIMVPHVDSRDAALKAVRAVKYAPLGERGMNGAARVLDFGRTAFKDYMRSANDEVRLIVQIEDQKGIRNVDEILCTPGVDMVATGKMDLSQALGVPGETTNPKVIETEERIIQKAVAYGKTPIIKADTPERVKILSDMGVRWFHVGRDESLLSAAMKKRMMDIRGDL